MSFATHESVAPSAPSDLDETLGFVRGLAYGLACVLPFWGTLIVLAWLAL